MYDICVANLAVRKTFKYNVAVVLWSNNNIVVTISIYLSMTACVVYISDFWRFSLYSIFILKMGLDYSYSQPSESEDYGGNDSSHTEDREVEDLIRRD